MSAVATDTAVDTTRTVNNNKAAEDKKAQKLAEKAAKDKVKLQKAKIGTDGKMIINTYIASDGMQVYYIVQEGLKKERLFDSTAKALIQEGKAVTITLVEFKQMVVEAKKAKKTATKTESVGA